MTPLGNALNAAREGCYRRVIDNSATRLDPSLHSEIYNLYTTTKVSQRQHANIYEASKSRIKQIILARRAEEIEPVLCAESASVSANVRQKNATVRKIGKPRNLKITRAIIFGN